MQPELVTPIEEFLELHRKITYFQAQCLKSEKEIEVYEADLSLTEALIKDLQSQIEHQEVLEVCPQTRIQGVPP